VVYLQCVYAHGEHELKEVPAEFLNDKSIICAQEAANYRDDKDYEVIWNVQIYILLFLGRLIPDKR